MDLRHIDKLSEDEHFWHLRSRKDGKAFKVAKGGLSEGLRGQIVQHFAKGGEVKSTPLRMARGGDALTEWFRQNPGQDIAPPELSAGLSGKDIFDSRAAALPPPTGVNLSGIPAAIENWARTDAPQGSGMPVQGMPVAPVDGGFTPVPPEMSMNAPPPSPPPGGEAVPPAPMPTPGPPPGAGGSGPPPAGGMGGQGPNFTGQLNKAYGAQAQANTEQARVAEQKAQVDLAAQDAFAQKQAEIQKTWGERYERNLKEQDELKKKIGNGEIDANGWWHSRNVGQKVAGTIGLILGGLASAFGNGGNVAKEMIDKAIANDVEAQKANLGKRQNALSQLMQQGNSLQDAEKLYTAQATAAFQGQLARSATKFAGPEAQARAQTLNGQLDAARVEHTQNFAMEGAKLDIERQKLAIEALKAQLTMGKKSYKPLPPEGEKVSNQLTALNDVVKLAKLHGKTNLAETAIPFGTTPSNVYEEQLKASGENIASGKLPMGRQNPQAVEHEIASLPKASSGRPLAKKNFEATWDAIHRNIQGQLSTLSASGEYDPAQIADLKRKLEESEKEAAGAGLVTQSKGQMLQWSKAHKGDPKADEMLQLLGAE